jgi:plastocyanin
VRVVPIVVLCLVAACGKSPPPATTPPPGTGSAIPLPPLRTGAIEGVVRLEGDDLAPLIGSVKMYEKYCGAGPFDTGLYKVDPATKGLAAAYVEADGRCGEYKLDKVPFLDQKACVFDPPMLVIPPGPIVFQNNDSMAHNVTIRGSLNPPVMEGFGGGSAISRTLPFEERIVVRCSIHPWMLSGLVVTRRAAYALTDSKGRFRIEGVEAGKRTLTVWHLLGDDVKVAVDVPADGTAKVEIVWKPKEGFRAKFGK